MSEEITHENHLASNIRFIRRINSTIFLLLAFAIAFLSFQIVTAALGARFDVFRKFRFDDIVYVGIYSRNWTKLNVMIIFLTGPFGCLLAAIIFYMVQRSFRRSKGVIKKFLFYLALSYYTIFATLVIMVPYMRYRGLGVITRYLYWDSYTQLMISVGAIIALPLFAGIILSLPFIQLSPTKQNIQGTRNVTNYYMDQLMLPWLILSLVVVFGFQRMDLLYRIIYMATMGMTAFIALLFSYRIKIVSLVKEPPQRNLEWKYFAVLLTIAAICFLLFN